MQSLCGLALRQHPLGAGTCCPSWRRSSPLASPHLWPWPLSILPSSLGAGFLFQSLALPPRPQTQVTSHSNGQSLCVAVFTYHLYPHPCFSPLSGPAQPGL